MASNNPKTVTILRDSLFSDNDDDAKATLEIFFGLRQSVSCVFEVTYL
jgi:hypothetical protein